MRKIDYLRFSNSILFIYFSKKRISKFDLFLFPSRVIVIQVIIEPIVKYKVKKTTERKNNPSQKSIFIERLLLTQFEI